MIEHVEREGVLYAIIVRSSHRTEGIHFLTPDEFSQQLAYMCRPKDYVIAPHVHNPVPRQVLLTKEVLFVRKGRVRVDFYREDRVYLCSAELHTGDVILLAEGGHGFQMLEESEIIEVKQGPYAGDRDKTRFDPVAIDRLIVDE